MILKILISLLIGLLVGGIAYVVLGMLRRGVSDSEAEKRGAGNEPGKQGKKKRPTDKDDNLGGKGPGSALTPTKEWVGGNRG